MTGTMLLSSKDRDDYRHKLKALMKIVNTHERSSHPQIADVISGLIALYENVENVMRFKEKTAETEAEWSYDREVMTDLEDQIIEFVIKGGPAKPKIERQSSKFI